MQSRVELLNVITALRTCYETEAHITKDSMFVRHLDALHEILFNTTTSFAQDNLPIIITPFLMMDVNGEFHIRCSEDVRIKVLQVLSQTFLKTYMDNATAFKKLNCFLLTLVYDPKTIILPAISEEQKVAILKCFISLYTRLSWHLLPDVYVVQNMHLFGTLLHLCAEMLKREQSRELRFLAVQCIMCMKRVNDEADPRDVVLLSQISALFHKFLPGSISALILTLDDLKSGHRLTVACVQAWGRLISMHMRQYEPLETSLHNALKFYEQINAKNLHDDNISSSVRFLVRLVNNSHPSVHKQLTNTCNLLIETCFLTLPKTIPRIIELLIILTSNIEESQNTLDLAVAKLCEENYAHKLILDKVFENFYLHLTNLPAVFNNIDASAKITALTHLVGFLRLFGKTDKLKFVLFTRTNIERLVGSLLLIATIEKSGVSLLEEFTLHDWKQSPDKRTPWKIFKYAEDDMILEKLYTTCHLLAQPLAFHIIFEYLQEVFHQNVDQRAEVVILLNELVTGSVESKTKHKQVLDLYLDPRYWDLDLAITAQTPLKQVQANIVQICLQLEGIGKIALVMQSDFKDHLLKVLYAVLEKAGSDHTLLKAAGLSCIANISLSCGYDSITELINDNADYFAYHVVNKLRRFECDEQVLSVLGVVLNYSNMEVLNAISDIIEGVLLQCFDEYRKDNIQAYLQLFHIFVKAMHRWLNVERQLEPMKSKQQKEHELEELRQKYLDELRQQDFSDDVLKDCPEEMFPEESENCPDSEFDQVQKTASPKYVQLIVAILERSLHFLPAKQASRKILVLEMLNVGVEILKDFEDDLLPIVHKIWSPLVNRFKELTSPLIIHLSFKLLSTLGNVAKEFIRMRSIKEVLPEINSCLIKQSKESYLKDRGSAYRYTQGYKMQLAILSSLGRFAYDLDLGEQVQLVTDGVQVYLNDHQPVPLQQAALEFHRCVCFFDYDLFENIANNFIAKYTGDRLFAKNANIIKEMLTKRTPR